MKYDELVYYEVYLLLGLKRFCEVIEVYCSLERDDEEEEDNEIGDCMVLKNDLFFFVNY